MNSKSKWVQSLVFSSLLIAGAGCGSKQKLAQSSATEAAPPTDVVSAETPVVRPITVPQTSPGDTAPVLKALTQALRKYSFEHRGTPRTFAEVVSAGYVSNLPDPPAGMKYEIDHKTTRVVIVNQ